MDPSAMDFVMHAQPDHSMASSLDQAARSPCPALRAAAAEQQSQHQSMISAPRGSFHHHHHHHNLHHDNHNSNWWNYHSPHRAWQHPPVPPTAHARSMSALYPDPFQSTGGPPQANPANQHPFPMMNAPENYNTHSPQPFYYRPGGAITHLPRISDTFPMQQFGAQAGSNPLHTPRTSGGLPSGLPSLNPNSMGPPATAQDLGSPSHNNRPSNMNTIPEPPVQIANATGSSSALPAPRSPVLAIGLPMNLAGGGAPASQTTTPEARRGAAPRTRRPVPRQAASISEPSSDDDPDFNDGETAAIRYYEAITSPTGMTEDRVRAQQLLRGAVSGKRVASRSAIASLQSVNAADLSDSEKCCVICYNDFGVETPEGVKEAPLRLPKCKHVFGDHCIKKWFEENDTCPYCRDKVPSEPQFQQGNNSHHSVMRFIRQQHAQMQAAMRQSQSREPNPPGASENTRFGRISDPYAQADVSFRRADGSHPRPPSWVGYPPFDRRSPPNDFGESRRRSRVRHSLRSSPPSSRSFGMIPSPPNAARDQRPPYHSLGFGLSTERLQPLTTHGSPQYSPPAHRQYSGHSHRRSVTTPSSSAGPSLEPNLPSIQGHSQGGSHPESFMNPLNGTSHGGGNLHGTLPQIQPSHSSPLSPTIGGPQVQMAFTDGTAGSPTNSRQQL